MKSYLNMPDTRPLDVWGNPIGKPYEKKNWEDLTPDEMKADFEWKSDVLENLGEEIRCDTFYQDYLFRELYDGDLGEDYKVLLTEYDAEAGNKIHKVDVGDIPNYLHLNDVALSPCLFHKNWRRKKLLNYVSAFVLDIDKLRPAQLQRFFELFKEQRLLTPTFIANSGSGVHFYYLLDKMLPIDSVNHEANNLISEEIYARLYNDVKNKEKWKDAQKHWLGQDYRVVNSKTKLNQTSRIFKVGEVYTIEQLIEHYGVEIDRGKRFASKGMIKYAGNIAKTLGVDLPDFSDAAATYEFIRENKDAAWAARQERREKLAQKQAKKKRKTDTTKKNGTWYQKTLIYSRDHTQAGFRFSSMKALALIASIESVPRDVFINDIRELAAYWATFDWKGDEFNQRNVEAIIRFFGKAGGYKAKSETLEEWLGYEFKRIGRKTNGRSQKDHLERARKVQEVDYPNGEWRYRGGRPKGNSEPKQIVLKWREARPDGRKCDCIRETGLSKPTVYRWWEEQTTTGGQNEKENK